MWALTAAALAFDPGTALPAPTTSFVSVSEQVVLSRTTLGFTRLDGGIPVVGFLGRFTVGATARLTATSLGTPGQADRIELRDLAGGLWFGWQGSPRIHHSFGITAGGPLAGVAHTYGLVMQEASIALGPAYRMHADLDRFDLDVSANANLNGVTILGGDLGVTGTAKLWDDRLGLQVGALGGVTEIAWLTGGLRVRPAPQLELGATALLGIPLDGAPVHVSPLVLVRVHARNPRAAVEVRSVMEPVPIGG